MANPPLTREEVLKWAKPIGFVEGYEKDLSSQQKMPTITREEVLKWAKPIGFVEGYKKAPPMEEAESWGEAMGGGLSAFGSGLTFGLSDYIPGAKEARQKFAKNHNILSPVLEVGGMVAPMLIPGGAVIKGGMLATKGAEALTTSAKFASGAGKFAGKIGSNLGAKGLTNGTNALLKMAGKEALINSPKLKHRAGIGLVEGGLGGAIYGFNTADGGLSVDGLKNRLKGSASGATFGALGGAAAPVASEAFGKVISPFASRLNKNQKLANFANLLKKEGVDLTAGQRLNSDFLQKIENKFGTFHAGRALNNQQSQFTRVALRKAGIDAMEASPNVLEAAKEKFAKDFLDVARRNKLMPDQKLRNDVGGAIDYYKEFSVDPRYPRSIETLTKKIATDEPMAGELYQSLRSQYSKKAQNSTNDSISQLARSFRDYLDEAMDRSIAKNNPNDLGQFRALHRKYKNFKTIQKAVEGSSTEAASGIITPSSLIGAAKNSEGSHNWTIGNSDFSDLARAGQAIFNNKPRASWLGNQALYTSGLIGANGLYFHSPTAAVAGLAPIGLGLGITTKPMQNYLTNRWFNDSAKRKFESLIKSMAITQGSQVGRR